MRASLYLRNSGVKYRARSIVLYERPPEIKQVKISKETEKYVWVKGKKHQKRGYPFSFFDTWNDAWCYLKDSIENNISYYNTQATDAMTYNFRVDALKREYE